MFYFYKGFRGFRVVSFTGQGGGEDVLFWVRGFWDVLGELFWGASVFYWDGRDLVICNLLD